MINCTKLIVHARTLTHTYADEYKSPLLEKSEYDGQVALTLTPLLRYGTAVFHDVTLGRGDQTHKESLFFLTTACEFTITSMVISIFKKANRIIQVIMAMFRPEGNHCERRNKEDLRSWAHLGH